MAIQMWRVVAFQCEAFSDLCYPLFVYRKTTTQRRNRFFSCMPDIHRGLHLSRVSICHERFCDLVIVAEAATAAAASIDRDERLLQQLYRSVVLHLCVCG